MATEIEIDGTPTNGSNPYIDSLVWGGAWGADTTGGTVNVTYALMSGSDPNGIFDATGSAWSSAATTAIKSVFAAWAGVANITFSEAAQASDADMWEWIEPASEFSSADTLGRHEVPGYSTGEPLYGMYNQDQSSFSGAGLALGGYGYVTLLHEIGHAIGLAHPHDGGDAPDASTFPGVQGSGDLGTFDLNQGIWTTMSYVDGWNSEYPDFFSDDYGWQATPMALDIAAIQAIYGANMGYRTGDDTYALPGANGAGTFWACIWDAGGVDTISAATVTRTVIIDLNEAPLVGDDAGGYVSRAKGIMGGFTIANGAEIENAIGGSSADELTGNSLANMLDGANGSDIIAGNDGDDDLVGGLGKDVLRGGEGDDGLVGDSHVWNAGSSSDNDTLYGGGGDDGLYGNNGNDKLFGDDGDDWMDGGIGKDILTGGIGADQFLTRTFSLSTSVDVFSDFSQLDGDKIQVDTGAHGSTFVAKLFYGHAPKHYQKECLVYNERNGKLFVDNSEILPGDHELLAIVKNHAHLGQSDFFFA